MHEDDSEARFNKLVGGRIRDLRIDKEWSQRELADAVRGELGLDPSAITRLERGERALKLREAAVLANALDVGLYQLLADSDNPHLVEFIEINRSARREMKSGREAFARMAIDYTEAVHLIDNHPEILKGTESFMSNSWEYLMVEAKEVSDTNKPICRLHVTRSQFDLLLRIVSAAVTNVVDVAGSADEPEA